MTVRHLGRSPVPATVVRDHAKSLAEKEQHLGVPVVRRQRPPMTEDDGLPLAPILVEDVDSVLRGDAWHAALLSPPTMDTVATPTSKPVHSHAAAGHPCSGSFTVKVAPRPTPGLSAEIVPPWASTRSLA